MEIIIYLPQFVIIEYLPVCTFQRKVEILTSWVAPSRDEAKGDISIIIAPPHNISLLYGLLHFIDLHI